MALIRRSLAITGDSMAKNTKALARTSFQVVIRVFLKTVIRMPLFEKYCKTIDIWLENMGKESHALACIDQLIQSEWFGKCSLTWLQAEKAKPHNS